MKKNKLVLNFIYQFAYQLLTVLTPLITTPYIARVLGPENNGIYTYTFSTVNYFVVFASLGIEAYGNRLIAQSKTKEKNDLNQSFTSLFWMHFIVSFFVFILYFLFVAFFVRNYKKILIIQSIWLFASIIDINWLFFGLEEFKLTVTRNVVVKIITTVCVFLFVRSEADLWIYTLIMGLGTLISNLILWAFIKQRIRFVKVRFKEIIMHMRPLAILFLAVVATSVYRMMDKLMLGWYGAIVSLASYEYADKMIRLVITIITALGTVMLPRMSSLYAEGKNDTAMIYMNSTSQFMFSVAFALAFGLASISDEFMPLLLGPGYSESVILVKILCISLPVMGWNNLVRTQILMPKEKDRVYTIAVWAGAITNIIFNSILIQKYGARGAAVSTVISYSVVSFFQTFPIRNDFPIAMYLCHTIIPIISGSVMFFTIKCIGTKIPKGVFGLSTKIVIGAVIYVTINLFILIKTKNRVLLDLINKTSKVNQK